MLFALVMLPLVAFNNPTWQWPVEPTYGMTGGFTEFRSGRFHAGVDFSIGGVEGMRVVPARSGRVFKIRADETGYGRVVYMRHDDGYMTVYAHLAAFGDKLKAQLKKKGYKADDFFGLVTLDEPLEATDTLGFAGESGAGLPHLHFEVRDADNRPVNPLSQDFPKLEMNTRPVLVDLLLLPQSADATVNGSLLPARVSWQRQGATFQAQGRIGLHVNAHLTGARGSLLPVRGLRLLRDDTLIGAWLPERVDYAQNYLAPLVFDQVTSGFGPTQYNYCFDARASVMPALDGYQFDGHFAVTEPTEMSVEIRDFYGEWHRYAFRLDPKAPAVASGDEQGPEQATSLTIRPWADRLLVQASLDGELESGGSKQPLAPQVWIPFAAAGGAWVWRTTDGVLKREVGVLRAGETITIDTWQLKGESLPASLTTSMVLLPPNKRIDADRITFESDVLRFGREGWDTGKSDLSLSFDVGDRKQPQQLGFYYWSPIKQRWRYTESSLKHGVLKAEVGTLTALVVARDTTPPTIEKVRTHTYYVGTRRVIPIEDRASGIDSDALKVTHGNQPMAFSYDRDRGWLVLPAKTQKGTYEVEVADRAGNQTSATVTVF